MGDTKLLPAHTKFLFASVSGVAGTLLCYPLDLIKNRMQVYGKFNNGQSIRMLELAKKIVKEKGIGGLYVGLGASVLRQSVYTGIRMGMYQSMLDHVSDTYGPPNILVKCIIGAISGAVGGLAGLPADVALTRISTDDLLPSQDRRSYKGVFNAMSRMNKEEGLSSLFRGCIPVILRATLVNTSQLLSYYEVKEHLVGSGLMDDTTTTCAISSMISAVITTFVVLPTDLAKTRLQEMLTINGKPEYRGALHVLTSVVKEEGLMENNSQSHALCSFISAFFSTTCVLPMDIIKIRIQNMRMIHGKPEYTGALHVLTSVKKQEGILALWKGFTPSLLRNGSQYIVFFIVYEKCVEWYHTFVL